MKKQDLINKEEISKLVHAFYKKVRKDTLLAPFFNTMIPSEEAWEKHLELLVKFWDLNLLGNPGFDGNPGEAHHHTDKQFKNTITTDHFDQWTSLWSETIDELFEGPMAEKAKNKAKNMAKGMYKKIIDRRPGGFTLPGDISGLSFG